MNVDDERSVSEQGSAISKGSLEFFLRLLQRIVDV